jgi:hypothetical protein
MKTMIRLFALLLALTIGVPAIAQEKGEQPKGDEKKAEGKKIDLPWTAEDFKKSAKAGMMQKYKIVTKFGDQETVSYMTTELTEVTDKGYKSKTVTYNDKNEAQGEPDVDEKTWDKAWEGLEFGPNTKISDEKIKVAAGEFECKLYAEDKEEDGMKQTMKIWFVTKKPGHIAKLEVSSDMFSYSMELVETK